MAIPQSQALADRALPVVTEYVAPGRGRGARPESLSQLIAAREVLLVVQRVLRQPDRPTARKVPAWMGDRDLYPGRARRGV